MATEVTAANKKLLADIGAQAGNRAEHQIRYNLYCNRYRDILRGELSKLAPSTFRQFQLVTLPIYRRVIDKRGAGLYRNPPHRAFTVDDAPVTPEMKDTLDEAYESETIDLVMEKAGRYLTSHRTVLLSLVWRHNRVEYDIISPMGFYIRPGKPDPSCLEDADCVALIGADENGDALYTVWYKTYVDVLNYKGERIGGSVNPYMTETPYLDSAMYVYDTDGKQLESGASGAVMGFEPVRPFVLLQYEDPDGEIMLPGGEDLVDAALYVGFSLCDNAFVERFQSWGQPVGTNIGDANLEVSPTAMMKLKEGQTFEFVAPPSPGTTRLESVREFLRLLAISNDIPPSSFDDNLAPTSGVALAIQSTDLITVRDTLAARLARYETVLFDRVRSLLQYHDKANAPAWNMELTVTPQPQTAPLDPNEVSQRRAERLTLNLESVVELCMAETGLSRDEATARLQRNKADNAIVGAQAVATDTSIANINPDKPTGIAASTIAEQAGAAGAPAGGNATPAPVGTSGGASASLFARVKARQAARNNVNGNT